MTRRTKPRRGLPFDLEPTSVAALASPRPFTRASGGAWTLALLLAGAGCSSGTPTTSGVAGAGTVGGSGRGSSSGRAQGSASAQGSGSGSGSTGASGTAGNGSGVNGSGGGSSSSGGSNCTHCPAATPHCTPAGVCAACLSDSDCPAGRHCESDPHTAAYGSCAACVGDAGCASTQVCVPSVDSCIADCRQNGAVTCTGQLPHCDFTSGRCIECAVDGDCPTSLFCRGGACVLCSSNADCQPDGGTPICAQQYGCVQCLALSDCPSGKICSTLHVCQ